MARGPAARESTTTSKPREASVHFADAFTPDAAFDVVPDWIALIDADCTVRRVNAAMAAAFGVSPEELVGEKCHELVHGTEGPILECPHMRLLRDSGQPTEERVAMADKGLFDVRCAPLRDAAGVIVGSVHMAHDVTPRVRAQDEQRELANHLQQVIDSIPAPVFQKDGAGVYRLVNEAFARAVGRERFDLLGKTAFDLYPEGLASGYDENDRALMSEGGQDVRVIDEIYADGEARRVELHRSVYADLAGRPAGIVGVEFDVTERELAEAALRSTQAGLVRAQQIGRMGSWEWDIPGQRLEWSDEMYRIWGVERGAALTPETIVARIHPDDRAANRAMLDRLSRGADSAELDVRVVWPDGAVRHLHQTTEVESGPDGAPRRAFGITQDVTELVTTQATLDRREALVRGLFDTMPSGCTVYEVHGDGRSGADYVVKDMNHTGLAIEGRTRENVVGKSLKDLRPQIDEYGLVDVFWRVWRTGDPEHFPAKYYTDQRYANWYDNFVFKLPTGEIVSVYNDVTAEKRSEEALRASEAELHAIFDLVGMPMMVMDTRGAFTQWNRALHGALGYPEEDLRRMTARDVTLPAERADMLRRLSAAMEGEGSSYRLERRLVTVDGEQRWFDLSVTPVLGADGNVVALIGAGADITESRRAKEALVSSEEHLREALGETVAAMGAIVALRDPYTSGHERRVAALVEAIATDMGLSEDAVRGLRHAAAVHDVGKVAVPAEILSMPRRLSEWEYSLVQTHVGVGHEVLSGIGFEQPVADIVLQHHERLDGSGYPHGMSGAEIMLPARILAVADVVEAMASHRPYRPALGVGAALDEIQWGAGRLYDEAVVASCVRVVRRGLVDLSEPSA